MNKFKIVVPAYNCERWIDRTITSIREQTFKNFNCLIIDDDSTDSTSQVIKNTIGNDNRFKHVINAVRKYALRNFYEGFNLISNDGEDILVTIDGDDWLTNEHTLQKVNDLYKKTNCLVTYGSFIEYPSKQVHKRDLSPYDRHVIAGNLFRDEDWKASMLRTFKKKLWEKVKLEDLIDPEIGDFYAVTYDLAMMFPVLEMAGERIAHISELYDDYDTSKEKAERHGDGFISGDEIENPRVLIYVYNKENPMSDMYIREEEQLNKATKIKKKPRYKREDFNEIK